MDRYDEMAVGHLLAFSIGENVIGQLRTPNPNIQGLTEGRAWESQKIDENGTRIMEKPNENH